MNQTNFSQHGEEDLIVRFFPADPRSSGRSETFWIISTTEGNLSSVQQKDFISIHPVQLDCDCACK